MSLAAYFIAPPENTLTGDLLKQRQMTLSKFCSETDTVRDETMKIVPKIVEARVAKHALGSKPLS